MPLYLHYLDRELRNSLSVSADPNLIIDVVIKTLLCTEQKLYCGMSLVFETCLMDKQLLRMILDLTKKGCLEVVSHQPTISEFLERRKELYEHDILRYPMYFNSELQASLISANFPVVYKRAATTDLLASIFDAFAQNPDKIREDFNYSKSTNLTTIIDTLKRGTEARGRKAITISAFKPFLCDDRAKENELFLRRVISEKYTAHYMEFLGADIVTGIPHISYYDHLARNYPYIDYEIFMTVLTHLCHDLRAVSHRTVLSGLVDGRGSSKHRAFVNALHDFIAMQLALIENINIDNKIRLRGLMATNIARLFSDRRYELRMKAKSFDWLNFCGKAANVLQTMILNIRKQHPRLNAKLQGNEMTTLDMKTKILICTASELETKMLYDIAIENGSSPKVEYGAGLSYCHYGTYNNCEVYSVKSQMGSSGPGGSTLTTHDALTKLMPDFVIALGIAFGKSSEKQSIGDILVSTQVQCYELQRVGEEIRLRGDKISANPMLVSRCEMAKMKWDKSAVYAGLLLSGDKLVDNKTFKQSLFNLVPDAIGGEMEGAGMIYACYRKQTPWLVIKAICDWGENKSDGDQPKAARNAIEFFWQILKDSGWYNAVA